ncbi:MAG TPA: SPFH domain-containing protein [Nakamurella multipartita]|nr:SPFH domain-containing protein [Nakamurella multipartita]
MSTLAWIILLILILPAIGLLVWVILAASLVRVPSGSLGLVMSRGKATDRSLLPGGHFVFAFRRVIIEEYPSVELAYRTDGQSADEGVGFNRHLGDRRVSRGAFDRLEMSGPPLRATLGDRTEAVVVFTVRFQLLAENLRTVHERFGPNGIFGIVRDSSARAVLGSLAEHHDGIEQFFGAQRQACEQRLATAVRDALEADGISMTGFVLGAADLGKTGEVVQATVRAQYELERERAEAQTRTLRALNDADLQKQMSSPNDGAWRYRETDLWRELVDRTEALNVALRAGPAVPVATAVNEDILVDQNDPGAPA